MRPGGGTGLRRAPGLPADRATARADRGNADPRRRVRGFDAEGWLAMLSAPTRPRRALVVEGCAIATVDARGTEYESGHLVMEHGRITAVGPGPAPDLPGVRRIDGRGCLATP